MVRKITDYPLERLRVETNVPLAALLNASYETSKESPNGRSIIVKQIYSTAVLTWCSTFSQGIDVFYEDGVGHFDGVFHVSYVHAHAKRDDNSINRRLIRKLLYSDKITHAVLKAADRNLEDYGERCATAKTYKAIANYLGN